MGFRQTLSQGNSEKADLRSPSPLHLLTHPTGSLGLLGDLDLPFLPGKMTTPGLGHFPPFLGDSCFGGRWFCFLGVFFFFGRWFVMRSRLLLLPPFPPSQAHPQANSGREEGSRPLRDYCPVGSDRSDIRCLRLSCKGAKSYCPTIHFTSGETEVQTG